MNWEFAAAICVVLALAGCSSGPPATGPEPAPSSSSMVKPAAQMAAPRPTTDALHFVDASTLTPVPSMGTEPGVVDLESVPSRMQHGDTTSHATWFYDLTGRGDLKDGQVHLWLRIDHQLVNPFAVPMATCPWSVWVEVKDTTGQTQVVARPCLEEGPVVAAGDRELVFPLAIGSLPVKVGFVVGIGIDVGPFDATTPAAVHLLTGTPDFDSRIVLPGLREPLP